MHAASPSNLVKVLLAVGALGSAAIVGVTVILGGALTPGYGHVAQFISELGEAGAPHEMWVRFAGFLPAGLLMLVFCASAFRALPRSRRVSLALLGVALYATGYIVAAAFPCDPGCRPLEPSGSQMIHNAAGAIGYLVAPAFLYALARAISDWPGAARLAATGYAASAVALAGLLTLSPTSEFVGLSQRALEASVLGWLAMLALYVIRERTAAN